MYIVESGSTLDVLEEEGDPEISDKYCMQEMEEGILKR